MTFFLWGSKVLDELILLLSPHFIAPKTTTGDAHRDVINVMSTTVDKSYHWKGEFLHCDGAKVLDKTISLSPLGFSS